MIYREDQSIRDNYTQCRGFILKNDEILVMYRKKNGEEYCVFPGGHMRFGEAPVDTAIREIEEETTIRVKNIKMAYEVTDYADKKTLKEYYFVGEWESGEPVLSGEESRRQSEDNYFEPKFVKLSEIPNLKIYPAMAKEWVISNLRF